MPNIFPKSFNLGPLKILIFGFTAMGLIVACVTYYATPKYLRVGYTPVQPVSFDHSKHAGQLGIDCRYCHNSVEHSEHAGVPAASTCMKCHSQIKTESPALELIRQSAKTGEPVPWVRVHRTPDYVYFNHAVHVNRGVSCVSCHDRVDTMKTITHAKPLSMLFCLECHRNPEQFVRSPDKVYDLGFEQPSPELQREAGLNFVHKWKINTSQSCSTCHK